MAGDPPKKFPRQLSHYRLGRLVGSGGMGRVYEATDRRSDRPAAIKLLNPGLAEDKGFVERFEREAHLAALLRSPYSAQLLQYGFDEGYFFIAMEYAEGQTLRALLNDGPLEPRRAVRIAVQVARALEEAEARGVVHRDIKPDNIMVGTNDAVKVLDFGIARHLTGGTLTIPGGFVGTLAYAAPEQAMGEADHRSDIYSLGATLYHALAGHPPYTGTPAEIIAQQRARPAPAEPLEAVPEPVVAVVLRCLEREPDDRYQSASELAVALERAGKLTGVPETEVHSAIMADANQPGSAQTTAPSRRETEATAQRATPPTPPPTQGPEGSAGLPGKGKGRWALLTAGVVVAGGLLAAAVGIFFLAANEGGDDEDGGGDAEQSQGNEQNIDEFDGRQLIASSPFATAVDTSEATTSPDDPVPSCGTSSSSHNSVWFEYVPAERRTVFVSTEGSDYNTTLAIFTGEPSDLHEAACNDDTVEHGRGLVHLLRRRRRGTALHPCLRLRRSVAAGNSSSDSSPEPGTTSGSPDHSPPCPLRSPSTRVARPPTMTIPSPAAVPAQPAYGTHCP